MENLKWKLYSDIGTTARIYKAQDRFNFYIKKVYRKNISDTIFNNEVQALNLLKGKPHFTKNCYIDEKNKTIYVDFLGNPLTKQNCPSNWKEQIEEILDVLKQVDLFIFDFQRNNICVFGNQINLIDFGVVLFNGYNRHQSKSCLEYVFKNLYD